MIIPTNNPAKYKTTRDQRCMVDSHATCRRFFPHTHNYWTNKKIVGDGKANWMWCSNVCNKTFEIWYKWLRNVVDEKIAITANMEKLLSVVHHQVSNSSTLSRGNGVNNQQYFHNSQTNNNTNTKIILHCGLLQNNYICLRKMCNNDNELYIELWFVTFHYICSVLFYSLNWRYIRDAFYE